MEGKKSREEEPEEINNSFPNITDEELQMETLISSYERKKSNLISFDRVEDDRIYLGFTAGELENVLGGLESPYPEKDLFNRFNALFLAFEKLNRRKKWRKDNS